jgi:predicted GNAT family acetyltransferase
MVPGATRSRGNLERAAAEFTDSSSSGPPPATGEGASGYRRLVGTDVVVRDHPDKQQFEAFVDGELAGFSAYERSDGAILIMHTEVDDAYEGQGIGSAMVRQMLDQLRAEGGLKVTVLCPFVNAWLRRHPDYQELTRR